MELNREEKKIRSRLPAGFGLCRSRGKICVFRENRREEILSLARGEAGEVGRLRGRGRPRIVEAGDEKLVARRYLHGGLLRGLTGDRFLSAARPLNELVLLEAARRSGVGVPEAAGLILERTHPFFVRAELVTVYVPGSVDLLSYYRRVCPPGGDERPEPSLPAIIAAAARQTARLHRAGILHGDLQMKNILVRPESQPPEVLLLDFDRGREAKPVPAARRANLFRLLRSYRKMRLGLPAVSRHEPIRFLRAYAPEDRGFRRDLVARARRRTARDFLHRLKWSLSFRLSGGYYSRPLRDKRNNR